jgi:glycosyltransferase involved in cell wall biosynthesis
MADATDLHEAPVAGSQIRRIALIGNFQPRRCGIATFTTDTFNALTTRFPGLAVDVYAMNDAGASYDYPAAVTGTIEQNELASYLAAARAIEASGADAVWLQHEYGIFGGAAGDHILRLIEQVSAPLIVTLHTILDQPNADQRRVLDALLARAARVIVMAEKGREILARVYGAPAGKIVVLPHGIPDRELSDPAASKPLFGFEGRDVILTFGLLSPGKGIETIIKALPSVIERFPDALYVVVGATHPHLIAHEGERYREQLAAMAIELGVSDNIRWVNEFLETGPLLDYLAAADIYVTPYLNAQQITSGTLAYAVGLGVPVVSTPYVHAAELLANGHGTLVDFDDSAGFAAAISALLADDEGREALRRKTYALGRTMIWPRYAEAAMAVFTTVAGAAPIKLKVSRTPRIPQQIEFAGVERLSDSTGMLQHSVFSIPDRDHGYCIDDNARALLLMSQLDHLDDERHDKWATVYASFLQHAWNPERRRFRNFMGFARNWLEDEGSEDSQGRTIWALGVTARDSRRPALRRWASVLYDATIAESLALGSPRARAFCILGAAAMLDARPDHQISRDVLLKFGDDLLALVAATRRPDWAWFEIVLAYDNCRLPEALIRAGATLGRQDLVTCGIETLDWIISQQKADDGRFRAVGSESFGRPFAAPLPYDQQPLEAYATIDACAAALLATGDARWQDEALCAYRWFLGDNDLDEKLGDVASGECYDGLVPDGVNLNQGAESVLAFQLATCAINRVLGRVGKERHLRVAAE